MSEQRYPVVMCDGGHGMCGVVAMDHTLGGLGRLVGSATQLPDGWSGNAPGSGGDDRHYCPDCTPAHTRDPKTTPTEGAS